MAKRGRVRVSGTNIEYEVRRSKRRKKTIQLTVEGGVARVAAPSVVPLSELREFVRQRARWILDRLSEPRNGEPLRLVNGEELPYLGRSLRMVVRRADVDLPQVGFDNLRLLVAAPRGVSVVAP